MGRGRDGTGTARAARRAAVSCVPAVGSINTTEHHFGVVFTTHLVGFESSRPPTHLGLPSWTLPPLFGDLWCSFLTLHSVHTNPLSHSDRA